jgi:hypothetical protein
MARLIRAAFAGATAGVLGTLAMDLVWYRRYRAGGGTQSFVAWETSEGTDGYEGAPAPARTAKAIADMVGVTLPDSSARTVNNVVHWMTGVGWGKAHGMASTALGTTTPLLGPLTGVVAWSTSYAVLPQLGVYKPIGDYERDVLVEDLTAHLVYGTVMGVTYRLLNGARTIPGDLESEARPG